MQLLRGLTDVVVPSARRQHQRSQLQIVVSSQRCFLQQSASCQGVSAHRLVNEASLRNLSRRCSVATAAAAGDAGTSGEAEIGIHEVVELRGIRANLDSQEPVVEYRVHWKDDTPDTWELATNVSPDLVRDFDERWWQAAKKGDVEALTSMLQYSRDILSQVVDENRRSALHFAAAIGNVKCVKLLADAGADINLQDREGYTPLHMASGYMHTGPMAALLEAGADPLIKDKQGRDVVSLVENLRKSLPPNMAVLQRIMALEQVSAELSNRLYEEVEPAGILDERTAASGSGKEYLVQFKDDTPDEWLPESLVAPDLIEDWAAGLERAPVKALLDVQQWGTSREYLVQWADGTPDSWEDEANIPEGLISELREQQPELFKGLKGMSKKTKQKKPAAAKRKRNQVAAAGDGGSNDGSSSGGDGSSGGGSSSGHAVVAGKDSSSSSHNNNNSALQPAATVDTSSREVVAV